MIIDGKKVSDEILAQLKLRVNTTMIKPCLAVIQIGSDEASSVYIKAKEKACNKNSVYFKHIKFDNNSKEIEIINKIKELNNDEYVNGILIQFPIPDNFNVSRLISTIDKSKDVDGLTLYNTVKLYKNTPNIIPCTPKGVLRLLEYYDIPLESKHVVIVGRSDLVSKPLFMMMLNENATVTMAHSKTKDLKSITKTADILISAVGVKHLITKDMVKEDSIVIDIGINREDNKLYGDCDFENIKEIASITPVPGGVGPMTVAMLLENLIESYEKSKK